MSLCIFGVHTWRYSAVWDCWRCAHCAKLKDWKGRTFEATVVAKVSE